MPSPLLFLSGVVLGQRTFFAITLVWVQTASLRVYRLEGGSLWPPPFQRWAPRP